MQFCFTLKLQKCFKKNEVSSAWGRVEDTEYSFWVNLYFKMFIILSQSTFKNQLAESNSHQITQSMCTNFMYKHTHTHTYTWTHALFLAWLLPVGCCRGLGCSLLSHSTHHWKTTIKIGSTLSKVTVPWKSQQCVSNSDGLPWCGLEQEAIREWKVSTLLNIWATAQSESAEAWIWWRGTVLQS